jgi:nucleoid DNA-binding protein
MYHLNDVSGLYGIKIAENFYQFFAGQSPFTCHISQPTQLLQYKPTNPMATITKRELVIKITDSLGSQGLEITQQNVLDVVQTLIDEISNSLAQGDTVVMRNFGSFQVREMKAKIGRNPKSPGKDVPIPARAAVKFKPGKEMKEKVATTLQLIRERE